MNTIRMVYNKIPIKAPIDKAYYYLPDRLKYGVKYNEINRLIENSQWWSREKHEKFCLKKIKELFIHAYEHTEYYKKLFESVRFNPRNINSLLDIEIIPFLDRDIVMNNFDILVADNILNNERYIDTTGGTTGNQLHFYNDNHMRQIERAFVMQIWKRAGFHYGKDLLAVLRNDVIEDGLLYKRDIKHNRILFSNFNLTDDNMNRILEVMEKFQVQFFHAYPSSAYELAQYIRRSGKNYNLKIKSILLTSENIYPGQKELIEEELKGKCYSFYGHSEHAGIAWWCDKEDIYHIDDEYGYMELIDEKGKVIHEGGKVGEIVCTGLWNYSMPFIRYRTGDFGAYCEKQECSCGRYYRLIEDIRGRWAQEMIIKADGSRVSVTALNMHSMVFEHIKSYQMIQHVPGQLEFVLVKDDKYSQQDEDLLIKGFKEKLGEDFAINIVYKDKIEKTKRGKHRYFIQKIEDSVGGE